jgi:hypothetical protein
MWAVPVLRELGAVYQQVGNNSNLLTIETEEIINRMVSRNNISEFKF